MKEKSTKNELLQHLKIERSSFEALIKELPEEQMEISGVQNKWSIKDIIAHITVWEQYGTEWIRSIADEGDPIVPFSIEHSFEEMTVAQDEMNEEIYRKNRDKQLKAILDQFQNSFQELVKQIQRLSNNQLFKTFSMSWSEKPITTREIVAWRYYHYKSHIKHIRAWVELKGR